MLKLSAQEGFKKWFDVWDYEIREAWKATEEDGNWSAYENFYRDWAVNYIDWCQQGDWKEVEDFKAEIRKLVD